MVETRRDINHKRKLLACDLGRTDSTRLDSSVLCCGVDRKIVCRHSLLGLSVTATGCLAWATIILYYIISTASIRLPTSYGILRCGTRGWFASRLVVRPTNTTIAPCMRLVSIIIMADCIVIVAVAIVALSK